MVIAEVKRNVGFDARSLYIQDYHHHSKEGGFTYK